MSELNPRLTAFNVIKKFEEISGDCSGIISNLRRIVNIHDIKQPCVSKSFVRMAKNKIEILEYHLSETNKYLELL